MDTDDIKTLFAIIVTVALFIYIVGALIYSFLSFDVGLCFITGRKYTGKLYSLDKKLIERRRRVLIRELKRNPYYPKYRSIFPSRKRPLSTYNRVDHITLSSLVAVTVVYILPTLGLYYLLFPYLWDDLAFYLVFFVGMGISTYRSMKPLGRLRPSWMDEYLDE